MVDTVRQWKYSPYKLDGQPVEIQTTIKTRFGFR
jgi:outer membrane biosynthesis protein TonB